MQDEPTPEEILNTVAAFLRSDILPQLSGNSSFQLRVAINALDLVRREITIPPRRIAEEHDALRALLNREGPIAELTAELAARIANRTLNLGTPGLQDFLWSTTEAKLAVDQPSYAGLQRAQILRAEARTQEK